VTGGGEPGPDAPGEAGLEAAGRALARWAGLSLATGLRGTLREAVGAAARELGVAPAELARRAAADDAEALDLLAEHAVVGETFFWRHPEGLLALAGRLAAHPAPLRVWCAGCATGEEAYGLAMALLEGGREGRGDRIVATDLSAPALVRARAASYGERALRRLPGALRARGLEPAVAAGGGERVAAAPRAMVELRRHNLLGTAPEGPFDAVACRNVLIYFEPQQAAATLRRLAGALRPGGMLLLGPVELQLAGGLDLEWTEEAGATLLRRRERP
jgi:chemotaxis protein methyltransferase CheR